MAFKLEVSGNYVVASDTISGEILGQFPINHCVYRENDNSFIILEQIDNEVVTIDKAQVDAGKWTDDQGTPFTQATLLTFLRANTGFNTAGGGSSAGYEFTLNHVLGASELTSLVLSPFEIIPQPLISAIFDFKLTFRFVAGTGAYGGSGQDLVIKNSNPYFTIPTPDVISINSAMIEELKDGGMVVYGNHSADIGGYEQITPQPIENRFLLTTNGLDFTPPPLPRVGGTLYIDAEYNVIPIS